VAKQFTGSTTVIGLLIGAEGLLALFVPLAVGTWSDQLRTKIGGRLPFVIGGVPLAALGLAAMGFMHSLAPMAIAVTVFFLGYFIAYEPYRALYPDLMDDEIAGRAQSAQAVARGIGTGVALVSGGLLMSLAKPAPFIAAAIVLGVATVAFVLVSLRRDVGAQEYEDARNLREAARDLRELVREHPALRWFLAANALWELSLAALKTFIVLFLTIGLGMKISQASLVIGATAVLILGAAAAAGPLADRLDRNRVMRVSLWIYGIGLLVPLLTQSWPAIVAVPFVAIGGGVIMALPYALLMPLMPEGAHGALTGYYSLSRGIGTLLGPIIGGVAVQLGQGLLSGTHGYAAVFAVCSLAILASIPLMRGLRGASEDRAELRAS
jgi:Na+/melibiose symporter-like transporter